MYNGRLIAFGGTSKRGLAQEGSTASHCLIPGHITDLASFPGFPSNFPSLAVREKRRGKPGRIYHMSDVKVYRKGFIERGQNNHHAHAFWAALVTCSTSILLLLATVFVTLRGIESRGC